MNKEQYLQQRNELIESAQTLIDEGKINEANAKMEEVNELDQKFENEAKAAANLNALKGSPIVTNIQNKGVNVVGTVVDSTTNMSNNDMYSSIEYRKAFMNHIINGSAIPNEFLNADANTKTSDIGAVIPTTVLEKIIEKLEATGMILPLVTRTSYKGGLSIPISTVKPIATWVTEGAGSEKQKKTTGTITFNYFKLRCAVSVSFETDIMALSVFETTLINNVTEAMTKALEQAIINGTGVGQPKGILAETPVAGQAVAVPVATGISYNTLIEAEAALPLEYENGAVWCMTKKTFMSFIGLVDKQGQPIARVTYGIGGKPERTLLGRQVVLTNYLPNYSTSVTEDTTFAFLFNFSDYILNTNYAMSLKKYEDNETDDQVTKAIMLADGKVVDKNSLVTLYVDIA